MRHKLIALTMALAAATLVQACSHDGGGRHRGPGGGEFHGAGPGGGPGMMQQQGPSRAAHLQRFDANADGKITRDEFEKVVNADFTVCDKDGNGELSPSETRACNDRLLTERYTSPIIDWNADGHVALDEFAAQWRTLFESADADQDGTVTTEELERPAGGRMGPSGKPRGGPGEGRGRGRPGGGGPGPGGGN